MNPQVLERLRLEVEQKVGRKMYTPKDFEYLSEKIFEQLHQHISTSTLKRLWGYLPGKSNPRISTFNLLAQFIGYNDWQDFCCQVSDAEPSPPEALSVEEPDPSSSNVQRKTRRWIWLGLCLCVVMSIVALGRVYKFHSAYSGDTPYLLQQGQAFADSENYLRMFGISAPEHYWDQPLPHHPQIIIWSPTYRHPQWHNEGDPDSFFPTITEYWTPIDSTSAAEDEITRLTNRNHYFTVKRTNELRITFMKNLVDTSFVFLGVYRMMDTQSDSTHIVCERVADQLDLSRLDYLEQLRN